MLGESALLSELSQMEIHHLQYRVSHVILGIYTQTTNRKKVEDHHWKFIHQFQNWCTLPLLTSISKNSTTWALISAKRSGEYNLLTCSGQRRAWFYGTHISLSPYQRLSADSIPLINAFVRKLYFRGRGEFCLFFVLALKRLLEKYLNLLEYSIFLFELLSISLISSILFGMCFVLTYPLSGYQPFKKCFWFHFVFSAQWNSGLVAEYQNDKSDTNIGGPLVVKKFL